MNTNEVQQIAKQIAQALYNAMTEAGEIDCEDFDALLSQLVRKAAPYASCEERYEIESEALIIYKHG